jgi:integrative and conjugative element protein (TIGR02256 family)
MPVPQLIYIAEHNAYQPIVAEALAHPDRETGGILVGRVFDAEGIKVLVVVAASGPGARAILLRHMFAPDTETLQGELNAWREEFALYRVDYVGQWHTHAPGHQRPSAGDTRQAAEILGDADYNLPDGIFTPIVTIEDGAAQMHGYYYPRELVRPELVEYIVFGGEIRALLDQLALLER